jgi:hypothetical protein
MGKSLVRLDRAEEAVGVFRKAIELDGGVAEGWHQLALALGELGRFISAAEAYRRALARDPRAATIWNNRACLFAREGQRLVSRGAGGKEENSGLSADPVYRWVFAHQVLPAVHALMASATVRAASHRVSDADDPARRFAVALEIVEGALATPGLPDSRRLLLLAGLVPPCVRSASGEVSSFAGPFRSQARRHWESLSRIDLARDLLVLADVPGADERDRTGLTTCLDVQERWDRFVQNQ